MKVIIAIIDRNIIRHRERLSYIDSVCKDIGIDDPIEIYSLEDLSETLDTDKDEEWLLFSNFPPTCSDVDNTKTYSRTGRILKKIK